MNPVRQFVAVRCQFVNEVMELSSSVRQFVYRNEHEHEPHGHPNPHPKLREFVNGGMRI